MYIDAIAKNGKLSDFIDIEPLIDDEEMKSCVIEAARLGRLDILQHVGKKCIEEDVCVRTAILAGHIDMFEWILSGVPGI